jgi:hypothetical protein
MSAIGGRPADICPEADGRMVRSAVEVGSHAQLNYIKQIFVAIADRLHENRLVTRDAGLEYIHGGHVAR